MAGSHLGGMILAAGLSAVRVDGSAPVGGTTVAHGAGTKAFPIGPIAGSCYIGRNEDEFWGYDISGGSVTVYGDGGTNPFTLWLMPYSEGTQNLDPPSD